MLVFVFAVWFQIWQYQLQAGSYKNKTKKVGIRAIMRQHSQGSRQCNCQVCMDTPEATEHMQQLTDNTQCAVCSNKRAAKFQQTIYVSRPTRAPNIKYIQNNAVHSLTSVLRYCCSFRYVLAILFSGKAKQRTPLATEKVSDTETQQSWRKSCTRGQKQAKTR